MEWNLSTKSVLRKRLQCAIESMEYEVSQFNWGDQSVDQGKVSEALKQAKEYATDCDFNKGWNQFNIANYHLVRSMNQDQLNIKAAMLRKEALKIPGWRKEQIDFLLGTPLTKSSPVPPKELFNSELIFPSQIEKEEMPVITLDRVLMAMKVRDDYFNTRNNRMALHEASVNALTVIICFILITILVLAFVIGFSMPQMLAKAMIIAALFGALGAGFSIAKSLFSFHLDVKIPDQLLGIAVTVIRLVVGAVSALIVLLLYLSGFFNHIFSESIINSYYAYIVFSFIAGFSERWVITMLKLVAKDT